MLNFRNKMLKLQKKTVVVLGVMVTGVDKLKPGLATLVNPGPLRSHINIQLIHLI